MFRHRGKNRTLIHNLKLASLLSLVAGSVNTAGFFAVHQLTTNVTGHFAFFADEAVQGNFGLAWVYLLYILAFFSGAFFSNFLVEIMLRRNMRFVNTMPVAIEIAILVIIGSLSADAVRQNPHTIACGLLFAMGLQNALVTNLSNSVVRTTHLTGLFTDLGIELSQLFFYQQRRQQEKLSESIKLRFTIIFFFFLGCAAGGTGYFFLKNQVLLLSA